MSQITTIRMGKEMFWFLQNLSIIEMKSEKIEKPLEIETVDLWKHKAGHFYMNNNFF